MAKAPKHLNLKDRLAVCHVGAVNGGFSVTRRERVKDPTDPRLFAHRVVGVFATLDELFAWLRKNLATAHDMAEHDQRFIAPEE